MKKYVIYTDSDDTIDNIIEKISSSPKYKNPLYILLGEDTSKIFLNKLNLKIFSEKIQSLNHEIVLVSKNINLFKIAVDYRLTVQNVLDENLSFSNILITKRKISQKPKTNDEVYYSFSNLNEKIDKLKINTFAPDKKSEIGEIYKQKKKMVVPLIIGSFFLLFVILFLVVPNSKVYLKPSSDKIKLTNNIIFAESKSNELFIKESLRKNVIPYRNIQKLYEKSLVYQSKGKIFEGNNAGGIVLIENSSGESFAIKKGTKLQTEDNIHFVTNYYTAIPGGKRVKDENGKDVFKKGEVRLSVTAADFDSLNNVIGSRGNIPKGIDLTIPKLGSYLSRFIKITSVDEFKGGTVKWRNVVTDDDLISAREKVLQVMKTQAEGEIIKMLETENRLKNENYSLFGDKNFLKIELSNIVIPDDILGKNIESFPVTGAIVIRAISYNFDSLYAILEKNLLTKVHPDMNLSYIDKDNLQIRAFDIDGKLNRIKAAVIIYGREDYDLFGKKDFSKRFRIDLKNKLTNLTVETAEKYLRNFPEVSNVEIKLWPPFIDKLPKMPGSIDIVEMK